MEYLSIILLVITLVLIVITLIFAVKASKNKPNNYGNSEESLNQINGRLEALQHNFAASSTESKVINQNMNENLARQSASINKQISDSFNLILNQNKSANEASDKLARQTYGQQNMVISENARLTREQFLSTQKLIQERFDVLNNMIQQKFDAQRKTMEESFIQIRQENNEQIQKIRESMNERIDKSLNEQFDKSFKGIIEQMNNLASSMGELKGISTQVGTLEKALNGVKTRGIVGERQLKLIIEDVLNPNQYEVEFATIPNSSEHVEIAIKLPDRNSNDVYYLPVDSKCHIDRYEALVEAQLSGDTLAIEAARKEFAGAIKADAKSIATKYIKEPYTTPYAILFVPFESMYSEIVNLNLLDDLNKMHITVVGPYTMMAVLSTIVNYWQALAIEKKSREIELTLTKTKDAFTKFDDQLTTVRRQLNTASKTLDNLQTTRTNAVLRALKDIDTLAIGETNDLLPESKDIFDGGFDE